MRQLIAKQNMSAFAKILMGEIVKLIEIMNDDAKQKAEKLRLFFQN